MTNDEIIDAMTSHACDTFFEGTERVASNEEFEAMRKVMVPIAIRIKELEATLKDVEKYCETYLVLRIVRSKK